MAVGLAVAGSRWGGAGCLGPLSGLPPFLVPGRAGPRAWGSAQARPEQRAGLARARVSSGRAGFVSGFFFVLRVVPSCCMAKYSYSTTIRERANRAKQASKGLRQPGGTEIGTIPGGTETPQWASKLGTVGHGADTRYLGTTGYSADALRSKDTKKTSKDINVNIFWEQVKKIKSSFLAGVFCAQ